MADTKPEFRPLDMTRPKAAWPFVIVGALVVGGALYAVRRASEREPAEPVKMAHLIKPADKPLSAAAVEATKAAVQNAADAVKQGADALAPRLPEGPNVLGGAAQAKKPAVVTTDVDRERARTKAAQKTAATLKKQVDALQKELKQMRAEVANMRRPLPPPTEIKPAAPPPTDSEQILQTLAPVLSSNHN